MICILNSLNSVQTLQLQTSGNYDFKISLNLLILISLSLYILFYPKLKFSKPFDFFFGNRKIINSA